MISFDEDEGGSRGVWADQVIEWNSIYPCVSASSGKPILIGLQKHWVVGEGSGWSFDVPLLPHANIGHNTPSGVARLT
jgi:hypothetical protein